MERRRSDFYCGCNIKMLHVYLIFFFVSVVNLVWPCRKAKQARASEPEPGVGPVQQTMGSRSAEDTARELVSFRC